MKQLIFLVCYLSTLSAEKQNKNENSNTIITESKKLINYLPNKKYSKWDALTNAISFGSIFGQQNSTSNFDDSQLTYSLNKLNSSFLNHNTSLLQEQTPENIQNIQTKQRQEEQIYKECMNTCQSLASALNETLDEQTCGCDAELKPLKVSYKYRDQEIIIKENPFQKVKPTCIIAENINNNINNSSNQKTQNIYPNSQKQDQIESKIKIDNQINNQKNFNDSGYIRIKNSGKQQQKNEQINPIFENLKSNNVSFNYPRDSQNDSSQQIKKNYTSNTIKRVNSMRIIKKNVSKNVGQNSTFKQQNATITKINKVNSFKIIKKNVSQNGNKNTKIKQQNSTITMINKVNSARTMNKNAAKNVTVKQIYKSQNKNENISKIIRVKSIKSKEKNKSQKLKNYNQTKREIITNNSNQIIKRNKSKKVKSQKNKQQNKNVTSNEVIKRVNSMRVINKNNEKKSLNSSKQIKQNNVTQNQVIKKVRSIQKIERQIKKESFKSIENKQKDITEQKNDSSQQIVLKKKQKKIIQQQKINENIKNKGDDEYPDQKVNEFDGQIRIKNEGKQQDLPTYSNKSSVITKVYKQPKLNKSIISNDTTIKYQSSKNETQQQTSVQEEKKQIRIKKRNKEQKKEQKKRSINKIEKKKIYNNQNETSVKKHQKHKKNKTKKAKLQNQSEKQEQIRVKSRKQRIIKKVQYGRYNETIPIKENPRYKYTQPNNQTILKKKNKQRSVGKKVNHQLKKKKHKSRKQKKIPVKSQQNDLRIKIKNENSIKKIEQIIDDAKQSDSGSQIIKKTESIQNQNYSIPAKKKYSSNIISKNRNTIKQKDEKKYIKVIEQTQYRNNNENNQKNENPRPIVQKNQEQKVENQSEKKEEQESIIDDKNKGQNWNGDYQIRIKNEGYKQGAMIKKVHNSVNIKNKKQVVKNQNKNSNSDINSQEVEKQQQEQKKVIVIDKKQKSINKVKQIDYKKINDQIINDNKNERKEIHESEQNQTHIFKIKENVSETNEYRPKKVKNNIKENQYQIESKIEREVKEKKQEQQQKDEKNQIQEHINKDENKQCYKKQETESSEQSQEQNQSQDFKGDYQIRIKNEGNSQAPLIRKVQSSVKIQKKKQVIKIQKTDSIGDLNSKQDQSYKVKQEQKQEIPLKKKQSSINKVKKINNSKIIDKQIDKKIEKNENHESEYKQTNNHEIKEYIIGKEEYHPQQLNKSENQQHNPSQLKIEVKEKQESSLENKDKKVEQKQENESNEQKNKQDKGQTFKGDYEIRIKNQGNKQAPIIRKVQSSVNILKKKQEVQNKQKDKNIDLNSQQVKKSQTKQDIKISKTEMKKLSSKVDSRKQQLVNATGIQKIETHVYENKEHITETSEYHPQKVKSNENQINNTYESIIEQKKQKIENQYKNEKQESQSEFKNYKVEQKEENENSEQTQEQKKGQDYTGDYEIRVKNEGKIQASIIKKVQSSVKIQKQKQVPTNNQSCTIKQKEGEPVPVRVKVKVFNEDSVPIRKPKVQSVQNQTKKQKKKKQIKKIKSVKNITIQPQEIINNEPFQEQITNNSIRIKNNDKKLIVNKIITNTIVPQAKKYSSNNNSVPQKKQKKSKNQKTDKNQSKKIVRIELQKEEVKKVEQKVKQVNKGIKAKLEIKSYPIQNVPIHSRDVQKGDSIPMKKRVSKKQKQSDKSIKNKTKNLPAQTVLKKVKSQSKIQKKVQSQPKIVKKAVKTQSVETKIKPVAVIEKNKVKNKTKKIKKIQKIPVKSKKQNYSKVVKKLNKDVSVKEKQLQSDDDQIEKYLKSLEQNQKVVKVKTTVIEQKKKSQINVKKNIKKTIQKQNIEYIQPAVKVKKQTTNESDSDNGIRIKNNDSDSNIDEEKVIKKNQKQSEIKILPKVKISVKKQIKKAKSSASSFQNITDIPKSIKKVLSPPLTIKSSKQIKQKITEEKQENQISKECQENDGIERKIRIKNIGIQKKIKKQVPYKTQIKYLTLNRTTTINFTDNDGTSTISITNMNGTQLLNVSGNKIKCSTQFCKQPFSSASQVFQNAKNMSMMSPFSQDIGKLSQDDTPSAEDIDQEFLNRSLSENILEAQRSKEKLQQLSVQVQKLMFLGNIFKKFYNQNKFGKEWFVKPIIFHFLEFRFINDKPRVTIMKSIRARNLQGVLRSFRKTIKESFLDNNSNHYGIIGNSKLIFSTSPFKNLLDPSNGELNKKKSYKTTKNEYINDNISKIFVGYGYFKHIIKLPQKYRQKQNNLIINVDKNSFKQDLIETKSLNFVKQKNENQENFIFDLKGNLIKSKNTNFKAFITLVNSFQQKGEYRGPIFNQNDLGIQIKKGNAPKLFYKKVTLAPSPRTQRNVKQSLDQLQSQGSEQLDQCKDFQKGSKRYETCILNNQYSGPKHLINLSRKYNFGAAVYDQKNKKIVKAADILSSSMRRGLKMVQWNLVQKFIKQNKEYQFLTFSENGPLICSKDFSDKLCQQMIGYSLTQGWWKSNKKFIDASKVDQFYVIIKNIKNENIKILNTGCDQQYAIQLMKKMAKGDSNLIGAVLNSESQIVDMTSIIQKNNTGITNQQIYEMIGEFQTNNLHLYNKNIRNELDAGIH